MSEYGGKWLWSTEWQPFVLLKVWPCGMQCRSTSSKFRLEILVAVGLQKEIAVSTLIPLSH